MVEGTSELKQQALNTLEEGRREIRDEARWIRRELNFRRVASRLTEEHTLAVLGTAFVVGLLLPSLVLPRKHVNLAWSTVDSQRLPESSRKPKSQGGGVKRLLGLVFIPGVKLLLRKGIRAALSYREPSARSMPPPVIESHDPRPVPLPRNPAE